MFWKKEKKEEEIIDLIIGKISVSTLKLNFKIVQEAYNKQLEEIKLNDLNVNIINSIKHNVKNYIICTIDGNDEKPKYYKNIYETYYDGNGRYINERILNKKGKELKKKIMNELNLPKIIAKEIFLKDKKEKLEEELEQLEKKYGNN